QAGRQGAVTIATNMAGRGTDILLGGNPDFLSKELLRKKGLDPATAPAEARQTALVEARRITDPEHENVVATRGLHIVATRRAPGGSPTHCAAARAATELPGRPGSTFRWRTTSSASSAPSASSGSWIASAWRRASRSSTSS